MRPVATRQVFFDFTWLFIYSYTKNFPNRNNNPFVRAVAKNLNVISIMTCSGFAPKVVNLTLKSKITGEGVLARRIYDKG